ncbi:hypothetical protein [Halomarina ordinaria]|uniref:Uncharacterized protein n=1 Tax=Halomarina ordinaria TaxID=3033939 RepID=A0ABD5UD66_9EURY|nr:hypothetical protein [Halomarina sp. PSRA2]
MVVSTDSLWDVVAEFFEREYDEVVVYGEGEEVLHEGAARVCANGWVELPTGRLLSPGAVHHIDVRGE